MTPSSTKMIVTHIPCHVEVSNNLRQKLVDNNSWLKGPFENKGVFFFTKIHPKHSLRHVNCKGLLKNFFNKV